MHNLNLYNYYDKSLADINREYLESLKYKPKQVAKKRFDRRHALFLAVLLLIGLGAANYFGVFDKPVVEVVEAPPPVDTRTEEEKLGYVQIQIFEFTDTPVETIKEEVNEVGINLKPEIKVDIQKERQPTELKTAKKEIKNTPPAPVVVKEYAVLFENISEEQFKRVKYINSKYKKNLKVLDSYSNSYTVWKVYEKSTAGSETIDGISVSHLEDFITKEDALEYADKRNIQSVIKQIGVTEKSYNIKICCSTLDNAKKIAQQSNITDRVIKILREK